MIGLGRVGLPATIAFALKGFHTIGADINQSLVESVNKSKANLKDEPELGKLLKRIRKGYLTATSDTKTAVSESEIIYLRYLWNGEQKIYIFCGINTIEC